MEIGSKDALAARVNVTAAIVTGLIAGFLGGCVLATSLAESTLDKYRERVAAQDVASVKEARSLLGVLQHTSYPPCSDSELNYFRQIVFGSDSIRDAGRIRGGRIECSASAGRTLRPFVPFKASAIEPDGTAVFANLVPTNDANLKRPGLQLGGAFVVFGSHLPETAGSLPIRLSVTPYLPGASNSNSQPSPENSQIEDSDGVARNGDILAATHCSAVQLTCTTASVTVAEARLGEYPAIIGTSITGGIAGALLGMIFCVFQRKSHSMEQQLRRAVEQNKLQVVYQPIVSLDNGKIVGGEALARWTQEDGTSVGPEVFIKVAEEHGFVGSITRQVVQRALEEFGEVLRTTDFRLNVNVTAADLADPEFLPMLEHAVSKARVPAKRVVIEVTESSTANQQDAMETIRELRRMGHSIYIDDFGTGYSTLSYLLYLSVDAIKIDKAFTRTIGTESVSVAILPQMMALARSQNLGVVVEGIETEQQAHYFSSDKQILYGQGFLFGRPITAQEFFRLLDPKLAPIAGAIEPEYAPERALGSPSRA
ncbi:MAG: EAL domain-containing protein [Terracidiphilus sp.]